MDQRTSAQQAAASLAEFLTKALTPQASTMRVACGLHSSLPAEAEPHPSSGVQLVGVGPTSPAAQVRRPPWAWAASPGLPSGAGRLRQARAARRPPPRCSSPPPPASCHPCTARMLRSQATRWLGPALQPPLRAVGLQPPASARKGYAAAVRGCPSAAPARKAGQRVCSHGVQRPWKDHARTASRTGGLCHALTGCTGPSRPPHLEKDRAEMLVS